MTQNKQQLKKRLLEKSMELSEQRATFEEFRELFDSCIEKHHFDPTKDRIELVCGFIVQAVTLTEAALKEAPSVRQMCPQLEKQIFQMGKDWGMGKSMIDAVVWGRICSLIWFCVDDDDKRPRALKRLRYFQQFAKEFGYEDGKDENNARE